jgi:hypothetical protein
MAIPNTIVDCNAVTAVTKIDAALSRVFALVTNTDTRAQLQRAGADAAAQVQRLSVRDQNAPFRVTIFGNGSGASVEALPYSAAIPEPSAAQDEAIPPAVARELARDVEKTDDYASEFSVSAETAAVEAGFDDASVAARAEAKAAQNA